MARYVGLVWGWGCPKPYIMPKMCGFHALLTPFVSVFFPSFLPSFIQSLKVAKRGQIIRLINQSKTRLINRVNYAGKFSL